MDFSAEILFANSGAIFTTHLESQLRPFQPSERHISVCWDTARDVLRQATFAAKYGAQSPWSEVMRRPTSCTNDGEHPARFRVWMKNGGPESVSSTFNCFVPRLTGTGVGRNSRTALNQFAFAKMLPEKWVLFGSLLEELLVR